MTPLVGATPYYAVIFCSEMSEDTREYEVVAERMMELAAQQPGFLGVDTARSGLGITVSYWQDTESIRAWRAHAEHTVARERGRTQWYAAYTLRVCKVEREYGFGKTER